MNWGPVRDGIVEAKELNSRCWIKMDEEGKVVSIYVKVTSDSISKFFPADEWEETLEGAKLRAEIEVERFEFATRLAKTNRKNRV
jgi:hypothetical protein